MIILQSRLLSSLLPILFCFTLPVSSLFQVMCELGRPCAEVCPIGQRLSRFELLPKVRFINDLPQAVGFNLVLECSENILESVMESQGYQLPDRPSLGPHWDFSSLPEENAILESERQTRIQQMASSSDCERHAAMDLIFAVDSSSSLNRKEFENMKNFVRIFVSRYKIGKRGIRVAVVQAVDKPRTPFTFTNITQKFNVLSNKIEGMSYIGGESDLTRTLKFAEEIIAQDGTPRIRAQKVVILLTYGRHNYTVNEEPPRGPADRLRRNGVDIFAISGGDGSHTELRSIVLDKRKIIFVEQEELIERLGGVSKMICEMVS